MARIKLTGGFTLIPEGTYIFKITKVTYNENFGKLEVTLTTQDGKTHIERFSLLRSNGAPNEGAYNAFSYFARTALNDYSADDIDPEELVGCFIECDVEHEALPSNKDPDKTITFARLGDKRPSEGWEEVPTVSINKGKPALDLKSILG